MPSLAEIGPVVLEKIFFKSSMHFRYLPFEKDRALHLITGNDPSPKDALCVCVVEIGPQIFLEEEQMKSSQIEERTNGLKRNSFLQKSTLCVIII